MVRERKFEKIVAPALSSRTEWNSRPPAYTSDRNQLRFVGVGGFAATVEERCAGVRAAYAEGDPAAADRLLERHRVLRRIAELPDAVRRAVPDVEGVHQRGAERHPRARFAESHAGADDLRVGLRRDEEGDERIQQSTHESSIGLRVANDAR